MTKDDAEALLKSLAKGAQDHHLTNNWIPFGTNGKLYRSVPNVVTMWQLLRLDTDDEKKKFNSAFGGHMDHGYKSHLKQLTF